MEAQSSVSNDFQRVSRGTTVQGEFIWLDGSYYQFHTNHFRTEQKIALFCGDERAASYNSHETGI